MYYPDDIVEEIRSRSDIVNLISSYVNLKKQGSNYIGLCPFHNEKTPSFSVSPNKQMYYCFGCGVGGNVFTFLMEYDNLTFPEAIKMLAERTGVNLPDTGNMEEERRQTSIKNRLLSIHNDAGLYYYSLMMSPKGKAAYEYFKSRQLSDETIKHFGLGYSGKGGGLYRYLKDKGYNDDELKSSGLITFDEVKGAKEKFWNRVMFPIMDVNNKVIAFGGRVIGDALPKYLNSPETKLFDKSRNLYGLNYARQARSKQLLLCEGYMDVIALHQAGFINACASLGTALTGLQANLIKRYASMVIITYDSDGAGVKAALRAIPILKGAGLSVRILNMRPYKDPDEFIKNLGKEEYQKRIDNADSSFNFEVTVAEQKYDFSDPEQKTEFYNEMARKILAFDDELERCNYIESFAVRYNLRIDDFKRLVARQSANIAGIPLNTTANKIKKQLYKEDGVGQAQGILLTWISNEPFLIDKIKVVLTEDDFYEEPYKTVASMVFEQYEHEHIVNPAKILNNFQDVNEQNTVASIFNRHLHEESHDKQEKEKVLNEIVRRIRQQNIDRLTRSASKPEELQKLLILKAQLQKLHISL